VFNVGADRPYSVNELADKVASAMGKPRHARKYLPARNEVLHAYSDHSKARAAFGVHAQTSLECGLEKMAKWASSVPARPAEAYTGIEVDKNLPPSWRKY